MIIILGLLWHNADYMALQISLLLLSLVARISAASGILQNADVSIYQ